MLTQILENFSPMYTKPTPFDPTVLNDPLALQIVWTPVRKGGANFQTHRLVSVHPCRMEFRSTAGFLLFGGSFMFIGVCAILFFGGSSIIPILAGLVFVLMGGWLIHIGFIPIVIDKEEKAIWKGRKSPREVFNVSELKDYTEIKNIHALQLISELCNSGETTTIYCGGTTRGSDNSGIGNRKPPFISYELNLVLKDGTRINLVDHGNQEELIADAQTLAEFLGVPLWNAL